jgi:hypothetical protein
MIINLKSHLQNLRKSKDIKLVQILFFKTINFATIAKKKAGAPVNHCPTILDPIFCLLSDVLNLPLALNAYISLKDFDPDFIATLLSRSNYNGLVEVVLDTGCTFAITPDRQDFLTYYSVQGRLHQVQTAGGPTAIAGHGIVQ